jgi:hypothetical protein
MIESTSVPPIDWKDLSDNWCNDSFLEILDIFNNSADQGKTLFKEYGWEIFDKVYEYSLSSTSCSLDHLLRVIEVLGLNCRPRELYIMVVEKLAGGSGGGLTCLTVLFYSMQLALLGLPSAVFFRDGLSLVLKTVIDFSSEDSSNNQPLSLIPSTDFSTIETAIKIALTFFENIAIRSKMWDQYHNTLERNSLVEKPCIDPIEIKSLTRNNSIECHHDDCIIKCLLQICSNCIVNIKDIERRGLFMQRVVFIIKQLGISLYFGYLLLDCSVISVSFIICMLTLLLLPFAGLHFVSD